MNNRYDNLILNHFESEGFFLGYNSKTIKIDDLDNELIHIKKQIKKSKKISVTFTINGKEEMFQISDFMDNIYDNTIKDTEIEFFTSMNDNLNIGECKLQILFNR